MRKYFTEKSCCSGDLQVFILYILYMSISRVARSWKTVLEILEKLLFLYEIMENLSKVLQKVRDRLHGELRFMTSYFES